VILSNVADPASFTRNCRIRDFRITTDDASQAAGIQTMMDIASQQTFAVPSVASTMVIITVLNTYPGAEYEGQAAFQEVALAEAQFNGVAVTVPAVAESSTTVAG